MREIMKEKRASYQVRCAETRKYLFVTTPATFAEAVEIACKECPKGSTVTIYPEWLRLEAFYVSFSVI